MKTLTNIKFKKLKISKEDKEEFLKVPDRPWIHKKSERPKCRWCQGSTRPLSDNGIIGPGYAEWNYVCNDCGKVQ